MPKDNTFLWLVGGLALGYLLMPKQVKEQIGGGGTTIIERATQLLPMSELGLPGEGVIINISEGTQAVKDITGDVFDITGAGKTIIDDIVDAGNRVVKTIKEAGAGVTPPPTPSPAVTSNDLDIDSMRQKVGVLGGVGTSVLGAGLTKVIPQKLASLVPKLTIKGFSTALKFIPWLGWGYALADIGATVYEVASGKNIAGDWLGWGEIINPEDTQVVADEPVTTAEASKALPEAASKPESQYQIPIEKPISEFSRVYGSTRR